MPTRTIQHAVVVMATLVCLFYVATLTDTAWISIIVQRVYAPPVPASIKGRDGRLTVDVKDTDGKPVPGAKLVLLLIRDQQAYLGAEVQTDAAGHAEAVKIPAGEYWILANADRLGRASTRVVLDNEPRAATLVLRPAHQLAVQVRGDDNQPVANARIDVRCGDPLPFLARSDAQGDALVQRLCPPPYDVRVSAEGYEEVGRSSIRPGQFPLRLVLRRHGAIEVLVVEADGKAAADATVYLVGAGVWPARRTQTDTEGKCTIAGLPAGSYHLRAVRGDQVSQIESGVIVEKGERSPTKLVLQPGGLVTVLVADGMAADSQPVGGANVVLVEGGLSSFPFEGRTDASGRVRLGPIAAETFSVSARADGYVPNTLAFNRPDDQGPIRVALVRGGTLKGEVTDARGFPVSGATIEVVGTDLAGLPIDETPALQAFRAVHFSWALPGPAPLIPAGELGVMPGPIPPVPHGQRLISSGLLRPGGDAPPPEPWISDRNGLFGVSPVSPGRVRAIVRHPGYVEGVSEIVALAAGGEAHVKVVLQTGGMLEGRVVDDRGFPVSGARVQLTAHDGGGERSTLTAEDGTFAVGSVGHDLTITVARPTAPLEAVYQKRLTVGNDQRKTIDIVLPAERDPVEVRVTDDRGYPIESVQVSVVSLSKDSGLRSTVFTSKDGSARIGDAVGIAIRVECAVPGYATISRVFDAAPKEVTIALVPGLRAKGRVTARGGREWLEDARVTVYAETGVRRTRTSKQGEFVISDIGAGDIRVRVDHPDHVPVERSFHVQESSRHDRTVDIDPIDMQEGGSVEGEVVDERGDRVVGARVAKDSVPTWLPVGPLPPGVAATDSKGEFTLGGLPEGKVTLEAHLPGSGRGRIHNVDVLASRTTHRVRITIHPLAEGQASDAMAGLSVGLQDSNHGVVVQTVGPGSSAERAGVMPGDTIMTIDGVAPSSAADARRKLAGPERHDVLLEIQRGGKGSLRLRVTRERLGP